MLTHSSAQHLLLLLQLSLGSCVVLRNSHKEHLRHAFGCCLMAAGGNLGNAEQCCNGKGCPVALVVDTEQQK